MIAVLTYGFVGLWSSDAGEYRSPHGTGAAGVTLRRTIATYRRTDCDDKRYGSSMCYSVPFSHLLPAARYRLFSPLHETTKVRFISVLPLAPLDSASPFCDTIM